MGGDLSNDVQNRRAIALFNMMMTLNDNRYQMVTAGYLQDSDFTTGEFAARSFFAMWRASPGAASRSPDFL